MIRAPKIDKPIPETPNREGILKKILISITNYEGDCSCISAYAGPAFP